MALASPGVGNIFKIKTILFNSRLTEAQKNANMEALNLYRLGWGSGDHTIILGVTNSPTFNFYWVTETDPVYGDRFPTFFGNFKREAEEASGKPYSMRFDNIIHREVREWVKIPIFYLSIGQKFQSSFLDTGKAHDPFFNPKDFLTPTYFESFFPI